MGQRTVSTWLWLVVGVVVLALFGAGVALMPRLLVATTYVPPTPSPSPVPPTLAPTEARETLPSPAPTPFPTSSLRQAPDFALPGARGVTLNLVGQLAEGPVVVVFFQRVGG